MSRRKQHLWFYRYRFTCRGQGTRRGWFVLLKGHDPEWEHVRSEP